MLVARPPPTEAFQTLSRSMDRDGSPFFRIQVGDPNKSSRSRLSSKSRISSRHTQVDESLFASKKKSKKKSVAASKPADPRAQEAVVVSQKVLEKLRQDPEVVFPSAESVVVGSGEFQRIMQTSQIMTNKELDSQLASLEVAREEKTKKARERMERMQKLEEERKNRKPELSDIQLEELKERGQVMDRAQRILNESHDQVKHMNQMVLYAQCVAIRDKQIDEKKQLKSKDKETEKHLDDIMEHERLAGIAREAAKEKKRGTDRREGAAVIVQQMKANKREKMLEQEKIAIEGRHMVEKIRALEAQDAADKALRLVEAKRVFAQVVEANQAQEEAKLRQKEMERTDDRRIAEYIKSRESREREHEEKLEAVKAEKELEIARLRAMQKKASDQQAELDSLRARRAQEEAERRWRKKEQDKVVARQQMLGDLAHAREMQWRERERNMKLEAHQEKKEFQKMVTAFQKQETELEEVDTREHTIRVGHSKGLKLQIEENERAKRSGRQEMLAEARRIREANDDEIRRLEQIKLEKLALLEKQNVPEKYRVELSRKKITIA
eukprot:608658_1